MDKYKLYDEILAKIYQNVLVEYERDGGIYITGYRDNYACNSYMKMAEAAADIIDTPVVMLMPLFSYLKFIARHWKVRKRYKWVMHFPYLARIATSIENIAEFVAIHYQQSMKIYEDIYKEFYE